MLLLQICSSGKASVLFLIEEFTGLVENTFYTMHILLFYVVFLNKFIFLFSKDALSKKTGNGLHLCTFQRIKKILKIYITLSTKILSSRTLFNIDKNKKCFLSSKSAYYNDFWRIMWYWRLDNAENSALHHRNGLNCIVYKHWKLVF